MVTARYLTPGSDTVALIWQYFMAAAADIGTSSVGGIYRSENFGVTWTRTSAPTEIPWFGVASSADGMVSRAGPPQSYSAWPGPSHVI